MADQKVFFDETNLSSFTGKPGEEIILPLKYNSSDGSATTGLGVNIYYDSSLLTLVAVDDQLSAMVASNTFGQDLADETNKDSDDSTDKYVNLVWGDFMGGWAGGTDPYTLANLKFKIAEGADLTEASTSIRIEESDTAIGYNFYGQDLNLDGDFSNLDFSRLIIQPLENNFESSVKSLIFPEYSTFCKIYNFQ